MFNPVLGRFLNLFLVLRENASRERKFEEQTEREDKKFWRKREKLTHTKGR